MLIAMAISGFCLAMLVRMSDGASLAAAWARLSPVAFGLATACFLGNLAARGFRLRLLAPSDHPTVGALGWLRLSAAHQAVFTLLPSGTGDAGFPMLARRMAGLDLPTAVRAILHYRLQDLWVLAMLAGAGLALIALGERAGVGVTIAIGATAAAGLALSSDLSRRSALLLARLLRPMVGRGGSAWRRSLGQSLTRVIDELGERPADGRGFRGALGATLSWTLAALALWILFAMVGVRLDPAQALVIAAGLNIAGALASFTVAGLGVSEGGLAAILMLLGFDGAQAIATALVVRPLLLINAVLACAIVEGAFRLLRRRAGTKPTTGTAADPA